MARDIEVLADREGLLERLSRIQRSISHGAPLAEVFSAIALGAAELLGDPVSGLRLVDEDDPKTVRLVASVGLTDKQWDQVREGFVGQGAGGRAIAENRVVVVEDYPAAADAIAHYGQFGVQNALAAPVRVDGRVVGSLTVASFEAGRRYEALEQEILEALAEHAGLALSDASLIDRRERRGAQRLLALVRHSSDLILAVDPEGEISFASPSVGRALGVPAESLLGTTILAHVHPGDRPQAAVLLRAAAGRLDSMPAADWRIVPSGQQFDPKSWIHAEVLVTNLLEDPAVRGLVLNARDITDRKRAEQARRHQDARYRQIVDTTHDGVWMTDRDDRTVFVNTALARMLGWPSDQILGRTPHEFLLDAEQHAVLNAAHDRRRRGVHERYELTMRRADGSPLQLMISATPMFSDDGYTGSLALCSDITALVAARTENAELETRLRQAQELETLGRLAGHVAHDFNQVLAVILGYATLLEGRTEDEPLAEGLQQIIDAAEHGAALAKQLVAFSRRAPSDPEILDLGDFAGATARMVQATAPPGVAVRVRVGHDPLPVRVGSTPLRQILMNLIDNAFHALAAGGELVLSTSSVTIAGATRPTMGITPGTYAKLEVADTGAGMAPEVVARALEPAFTTKPTGMGSGLGLAIVHGAVQQAGGHVSLRSVEGRGTTVSVLLPLAQPAEPELAPTLPEPDVASEPAAASGKSAPPARAILLAEDDPAVLEITRRVLTEDGYAVTAVASAEAALEAAEGRSFDLVLTDHSMPGVSGLELAERLAASHPETPAIVMSGYVAEVADGQADHVAWLQKPFGARALRDAVRGALAGS
jgi:two-component system cell cycle sensor histidine kinase/response regulator CckA